MLSLTAATEAMGSAGNAGSAGNERRYAGSFPGAACCRLTELPPDKAAPLQLVGNVGPVYLHHYTPQRRLLKPCRTGLAIGLVICEFLLPIAAMSDVFIACLANCRNGYPMTRF
jgi:hypothetical protein